MFLLLVSRYSRISLWWFDWGSERWELSRPGRAGGLPVCLPCLCCAVCDTTA
jgi:hypothetical protein